MSNNSFMLNESETMLLAMAERNYRNAVALPLEELNEARLAVLQAHNMVGVDGEFKQLDGRIHFAAREGAPSPQEEKPKLMQ